MQRIKEKVSAYYKFYQTENNNIQAYWTSVTRKSTKCLHNPHKNLYSITTLFYKGEYWSTERLSNCWARVQTQTTLDPSVRAVLFQGIHEKTGGKNFNSRKELVWKLWKMLIMSTKVQLWKGCQQKFLMTQGKLDLHPKALKQLYLNSALKNSHYKAGHGGSCL